MLNCCLVCGILFIAQQKFTTENEKLIKKFGMMRKYDDSQEFLLQHSHLACEETANYLVIWCINLEVEEVRPGDHALIQFKTSYNFIRADNLSY